MGSKEKVLFYFLRWEMSAEENSFQTIFSIIRKVRNNTGMLLFLFKKEQLARSRKSSKKLNEIVKIKQTSLSGLEYIFKETSQKVE